MERSIDRSVQVAFRTSKGRRDEIKRRADEAGVSVQIYLEAKALDLPFAPERPAGKPARTQEELPIAI
ncbi:hypothetical protein BKA23_3371 [Rudaeicoccus suwonensis]|uniref:Uncharacterized protein n=1 Tax=Rudaeicoccus suwonensis TaxID=657409 RepID=A0A561DVG6_9MICO|nr:hypothetical protein BKA23_3371 [Rudaeicoccus suwonensis]